MAKKTRKKNPQKSGRKLKKGNGLKYFCRMFITNKKIGILALLVSLAMLGIVIYEKLPPSETDVLKDKIEKNINTIEAINKENNYANNDTSVYAKLLHSYQLKLYYYVRFYKVVSDSKLSKDYVDYPIDDIKRILKEELEYIDSLKKFEARFYLDFVITKMYANLTDSTYMPKEREEKIIYIKEVKKEKDNIDSIRKIEIIKYINNVDSLYKKKMNYKKDLQKVIILIKEVTDNLLWYRYHNALMEFAIETNNLMEISKREYVGIPPLDYLIKN